jgi:DNA invertase Pin-like site-specific DNA recombinase
MQMETEKQPKMVVRVIPPTINSQEKTASQYRQLRVVAYCRVSTKQEEQLNSYDTQKTYYTDRINAEPNWKFVGIFADKGITGTSIKHREEFKKMIKLCQQGKVDMIITKSISRFARNTVDCLTHTRMLKALGVDVYFEEQGIHSIQPEAEFYISIYGTIAQSESENISANVKWGKAQSAREGKVPFQCKYFLGYQKDEQGQILIVPEEAEVVKLIYRSFLDGESMYGIRLKLESMGIKTPRGSSVWSQSLISSILTNEKYIGDVLINKTYVEDCISKRVKVNNGEREKFYIENHHSAIIDRQTFARVQEELARRKSKPKVKQLGAKTYLGKYSSKYALTELLICGECKTPYRRCTWSHHGKKKVVWRCINRLEFGKKYCHDSPAIEESLIHEAIMSAVQKTAMENTNVLKTLKDHISQGISTDDMEDNSLDIQIRIKEIDERFQAILNAVSSETVETFDSTYVAELMQEKNALQQQLARIVEQKQKRKNVESRLDEIYAIIDGLKNHPMKYDDKLVRQIIECVVVESKEVIKIVFIGGLEVKEGLLNQE